MIAKSNRRWARLQGTIHYPFRITFPRAITVANRGSPSPLQMIEFQMGWAGWQTFSFSGRCEQGFLSGELRRTVKRSLLLRDFAGELSLNSQPLGIFDSNTDGIFGSNTDLRADQVAGINSARGTFSLVLRRVHPGMAESDLILDAGELGPIAEIFGLPQTKFIGRVKYGQFTQGMESRILTTELRAGAAGLLAIYFWLIQPMCSTPPAG